MSGTETTTTLELTTKQLIWLKNNLIALSAYKNMKIPLGAVVYEQWHEDLLDQVVRKFHL